MEWHRASLHKATATVDRQLLSLNEIRNNAIAFSGKTRERAEKDSYWNDFGIKRRAVTPGEGPVKTLSGKFGHIDVFFCGGTFLAKHKSARRELMKKRGGELLLPAALQK